MRWVAGSYLFKMPLVGWLLRHWVQCIPKTQGRNDLSTIRNISAGVKEGGLVGLFPEGTRTWDGDMMDITSGTAKLVRMLKAPTVFVNIEGGFPSKPRWTTKARKGPITIRITGILSSEEIARMGANDIEDYVRAKLTFSNAAWQDENHVPYRGKEKADGIRNLVYCCPECGGWFSVREKGNSFSCSSCGASWTLDDYDRAITADGEALTLPAIHKQARERLLQAWENAGAAVFPPLTGVLFQRIGEKGLEKLSEDFTFTATKEGIELSFTGACPVGDSFKARWEEIGSMVVNAKMTLELFTGGGGWRIRLSEGALPVWELWQAANAPVK